MEYWSVKKASIVLSFATLSRLPFGPSPREPTCVAVGADMITLVGSPLLPMFWRRLPPYACTYPTQPVSIMTSPPTLKLCEPPRRLSLK